MSDTREPWGWRVTFNHTSWNYGLFEAKYFGSACGRRGQFNIVGRADSLADVYDVIRSSDTLPFAYGAP